MLLTAGTFLQDGRYWVEDILEQDETGISYRAQHRNLDQPVVIQTMAPELCDRPDAQQLLQTFMGTVRRHSQTPAADSVHVLDCFIELGLPFVVLEMPGDGVLPKITAWLPGLQPLATVDIPSSNGSTVVAQEPSPQSRADSITLEQPVGTVTNGHASTNGTTAPSPKRSSGTSTKKQPLTAAVTTNGSRPAPRVVVSQPVPRRVPGWLPTSLAVTALVGGCTGAFFGWQLRQGKSISDVMPVVGPKTETDQSFPPLEGWPAAEEASEVLESGSGLDQVLQRRSTTDRQERDRPTTEESIPIEPYPINYGTSTSTSSDDTGYPEYYDEPDYTPDSYTNSAPIGIEQSVPEAEPVPLATPAPEDPAIEPVTPPPAIAIEEPIPIEKPVVTPPPVAPPPETASPRSSNPRPPVVNEAPLESDLPQS